MDKITMIKEVRKLTGCGLKESKELVEEYQAGDLSRKELMEKAEARAKTREPRSEEYRQIIANTIKGMKYKVESLEEYLDVEWDDFIGARRAVNDIDNRLTQLARLINKLEELLSEEAK